MNFVTVKPKIIIAAIYIYFNTIAFAQLPIYLPTNGLVAWYPFNGGTNDESGNGNDGTNYGATQTQDRFSNANSAFYFNGNNCSTFISANINTSTIQTGLTISIWVCRIGYGCWGPRLFEFGNNNGPGVAQWTWDNNNGTNIGSITTNGGIGTTFNPVSNNTWTHLVYTNDGNFGKVYQDGILIRNIPSTGSPILQGNVQFGRMNHPSWDSFNGKLDDIGIWNRALNQTEVLQLYNNCLASTSTCNATVTMNSLPYIWNGLTFNGAESKIKHLTNAVGCDSAATLNLNVISNNPIYPSNGLVGWWPFNGNANDESGNGNNGILHNVTTTSDRFGNLNSAFNFNGNSYISIADNNLLDLTSSFTISAWVYAYSFSTIDCILAKKQNFNQGSGYCFGIWNNFGDHVINMQGAPDFNTNTYPDTSGRVSLNNWNHLTSTFDANTNKLKYFLNGAFIEEKIVNFSQIGNTSFELIFGAMGVQGGLSWYLNGKIDDIAIYNRVLTPTEIITLNESPANLAVTAIIEGLYLGTGEVIASPNKSNSNIPTTIGDTLQIELRSPITPFTTEYNILGIINTNGAGNFKLPRTLIGSSYYIVIKHRNSIETWSANPITIGNNTIYNFTTSASQAYGGNLKNMGDGVFAIYSGDFNHDGSVDFNDYPDLDIASNIGLLGYDVNDLNGDASVDFNDYPILDINSSNGVLIVRP